MKPLTYGAVAALLATFLLPSAAQAAPTADTPYPTFKGDADPVPAEGTSYHVRNQLQAIYDADVAAGAGSSADKDFWFDRMLARTGNLPGGSNGDANQYLFSRGRAVFMKTHSPGVLGFGGEVAYIESIAGGQGAYTVTASVNGADVTLTEDTASRKQTPSYFRGVFNNTAAGVRIVETKFITDANVAVTDLDVSSTNGSAKNVVLTATSAFAKTIADDSGELTGSAIAFNKLTTIFPRFSGDGFAPVDGTLKQTVAVPASGAVKTKLQLGFITKEQPGSTAEYAAVKGKTPAAAYTDHVTAYNKWWADNVPYLDTPDNNIDKTLFYRWWLMRYNFLDADLPGNDYQFPTSMEGVLGYNNAIVLTVGMFVDDLKYFRDPVYSYGPWVSAGEVAKSSKYVDNPGDPANWSNSYTEYISEAAWRSYQLHGGPSAIAGNLAKYAENDVKGLQQAYDTNGNGLIEYNWGAMTGNDADAVSFDWKSGNMDRAENAYLYSNATASAAAYRLTGNTAKADKMEQFAARIKAAVLQYLWEPAQSTPDVMGLKGNLLKHSLVNGNEKVPWKEINNYYPYAVGLMPKPGDADYTQPYVEALRLFADDAQYPIFPFTTANQADKAAAAAAGDPGSNNFSVINSTVTFRMLSSVLRNYPSPYLNAEWYKKLLYWNAFAHYQNGDNRYPDQNEFWADGTTAGGGAINYRSWIHHTILGATNFTVIEDAMGLRPRDDAKVELDPIDIGWDHFTANNIRYRDKDLSVVWDAPGGTKYYGADVPEGYSVYLDGRLAFTADKLGKIVYDPATGTVDAASGVTILSHTQRDLQAPQDVRFPADARIVDVMAKAGADINPASTGKPNVAAGKTATATFSASGRGPAGAVDGTTVNEPFWGTAGSPNASDSLDIDLGSSRKIDDVRVYFYKSSTSATVAGYSAPAQFIVQYDNGDGWKTVPSQTRSPAYPQGNLNQVRFPSVEASKLRVTVQHAPGSKTGIKEVQAYDSGVAAPAAVNAPPLADAWLDSSYSQAGSARIIGLAQDDGDPGTALTSAWTVVDAPDGGSAAFDPATAASTVARFTRSGRYTLRLTVSNGTATAVKDVVVQATALSEGEINVASTATPSASFTAGWNSVTAVNDGKPALFTGGAQTDLWGTWTGSEPATRWLQYDFPSSVRVNKASIDFWSDSTTGGSGVAVPKSWKLQYWDGTAFKDVTGATGFDPAVRGSTNNVSFDPVTTTRLRATFNALPNAAGTAYSAVGVSEWRVLAAAASSIQGVDARTPVGVAPALPATVDVTYADGSRLPVAVAWGSIDPAKLAAVGDFTVSGFVAGTTLNATAHVWVRGSDPVQINTVDPVTVTTKVGVAPTLPAGVTVGYNDGSRQSGIGVTWAAIDPASYASARTFDVTGQVAGTDKTATATVVVGDGGSKDEVAPIALLTTNPALPAGWANTDVTVTATATDNQDDHPSIQVAVGSGAFAAYTAPITVSAEGSTSVKARATDKAGNVSPVTSVDVGIDKTVPTATAALDAAARAVTVTGADTGSGISSVQYRLTVGGVVTQDWTTASGPVPIGSSATTVDYRAVDKASNTSAVGTLEVAAGPAPVNVARTGTASASYTPGWVTADNIADGVQPSGPVGPNTDVWNTWPQVGEQWIQLDWSSPVTVDHSRIWFTHDVDESGAGVAPPASWKIQYWDGAAFQDVQNPSAYGTSATGWNTVTFGKVTTTKLRALLASGEVSPGVQEWEVYDVPGTPDPQFDVQVQAKTQCVGGKVYVAVNAVNADSVSLDIELVTPYGSKKVVGVVPGKTAYQQFNSRAAIVAAGTATVKVTGGAVTTEIQAPYGAASCG
ncbi:galactose-binding domain-containing protein [Paractinoplanes durhamensis]|uniref:Carbohydrate-binding protein n=1 Tax=Paractinoplanes durhamensis TaxID=113563 RepID=A0ABQ3YUV2_9ACTN|nr:Ig-like domain-containing protein [Actinoplanes durhamensis]GIE01312.1 carbohydrate-binding protein [Actinoplanes durhamensis]